MTVAGDGTATLPTDPDPSRPRRRRRWPRVTLFLLLALLLLALVATVGVGYYFSGVLLSADNSVSYPVEVKAVNGNQVTLSRGLETERRVVEGLWWDGGAVLLSDSVSVSGDSVTRTVTSTLHGWLTAGLHATVDIRLYDGNPHSDRGLRYDAVTVTGELGAMPAWFVPPTASTASTTWVIAVHGRRGTMTEPLRILPTLAASGHPTLVISYRNDPNAPRSPDGYYHLGDSEWRDVDAAIGYARAHGATSASPMWTVDRTGPNSPFRRWCSSTPPTRRCPTARPWTSSARPGPARSRWSGPPAAITPAPGTSIRPPTKLR